MNEERLEHARTSIVRAQISIARDVCGQREIKRERERETSALAPFRNA